MHKKRVSLSSWLMTAGTQELRKTHHSKTQKRLIFGDDNNDKSTDVDVGKDDVGAADGDNVHLRESLTTFHGCVPRARVLSSYTSFDSVPD